MRYIDGFETKKMEEKKPHALEMGKEEKKAHQEKAEEASRRTLRCFSLSIP